MSHASESNAPRRARASSSPGAPVPPSVLMKAYISSSPSDRPSVPYIEPRNFKGSITSSSWDHRLDRATFERPRRTSDPSRSHARSASEASPGINQRVSHTRTRPVNTILRPTSSSYAPIRSSPLCISPTEEDKDVPDPIILSYIPEPITHDTYTALMYPLKSSPKAPVHDDLPVTHVVRVRDTRSTTTKSKRLSFAGLSALFSGKKECRPTPNTLILENRYCEQYIPPTSEGIRFHKKP
ncbi:hypothetical protein HYPSUDRAFT_89245 [Hypholoma sublateritium FD-334 SS-4]|uniref:Uncharacterized protein n=1 Tax=Hypholoma sublateritium (strain FD-334 SS-4) TaxID=945553 RepID=A0A0D2PI87_HYPSF|nr:hypothetical protein HYPSUDRAFT_89245 [Hypholoma sublateritium FD-334 SS-4]